MLPLMAVYCNADSDHPGGVNALLADGRVCFIRDTINPRAWWALGTRAGGEVLTAEDY
jgi:prepilin-type processing-associated H-X9-DG protein